MNIPPFLTSPIAIVGIGGVLGLGYTVYRDRGSEQQAAETGSMATGGGGQAAMLGNSNGPGFAGYRGGGGGGFAGLNPNIPVGVNPGRFGIPSGEFPSVVIANPSMPAPSEGTISDPVVTADPVSEPAYIVPGTEGGVIAPEEQPYTSPTPIDYGTEGGVTTTDPPPPSGMEGGVTAEPSPEPTPIDHGTEGGV